VTSVLIAGAGVVGLSCALELATAGRQVTLVDRNVTVSSWNGSQGETRLLRTVYSESPDYVVLAKAALERWKALEAQSGTRLFVPTGLLEWGPEDGPLIRGSLQSEQHGALQVHSAREAAQRFPRFRFPRGTIAIFDRNAGVLRARVILKTLLARAQAAGVEIRWGHSVRSLAARGGHVEVDLGDSRWSGDRVILAAGGWTPEIAGAPALPTRPIRRFFWERTASAFPLSPEVPSFAFETDGAEPRLFYGFPETNETPFKVAEHSEHGPTAAMDGTDSAEPSELNELLEVAQQYLPGLDVTGGNTTPCYYDQTPDGHFAIGEPASHPGVLIIAGTSGHGFKFGPIFGAIASEWVRGHRSTYQLECFRLARLGIPEK
jgi:glycine/D-amino acid oxidase-like deaminating enzyme